MLNSIQQSARQQKFRLKWGDNGDEALKKNLTRENSDFDLINKDESQITKIDNHRREFRGKSLLKRKLQESQIKNKECSV